ncbi:CPBP family intramembrane metalloprotease [Lactobacillus sp. 23-2]|uniref:CPBP family intramembrane glutamic endopeptidase n=1 Tax=Lactobacillus sp. 23-2 TaxID=2981842 RepID=UPI0038331A7E
MNTPQSREGNIIRYLVYFAVFIFTALVDDLAIKSSSISIWNIILFVIVASMCTLFYIYRYNREQRFFDSRFNVPWLSSYRLTVTLSLLVAGGRIGVSYLQLYHGMAASPLQNAYLAHASALLYWFMMVANGVVMPVLEEYLCTGFLFNYWFRAEQKSVAYLGILCSGLLYAALSFQFAPAFLACNVCFGMLFAWSYLSTQTIWMPIYLAALNGVLTMVTVVV